MKLKCCLVSRRLACLSAGEKRPDWIARHIERCEKCAAEADAYAKLGSALRACGGQDERCGLAWASIAPLLARTPAGIVKRRVSPALAVACLWLVVGVTVFTLLVRGPAPTPTVPQSQSEAKSPGQLAVTGQVERGPEPGPLSALLARLEEDLRENAPRTEPTKHKQRPRQRRNKPARPRIEKTAPRDTMVANPQPEENGGANEDEVVVFTVAPEEYVIDVVGVNVDTEDEDRFYVIEYVEANGESRAAAL